MSRTDAEWEHDIFTAFRRVSHTTQRQSMQPWLHLDLSTAQLKTLALVAEEPASTIGQIATVLGITLPTASHLVDKLVRAGLVERHDDPLDRRRAIVQPSPQGAELIASLRSVNEAYLRGCLARMAPDDRAALLHGMNALADAAYTLTDAADPAPVPTLADAPASV